MASSRAAWVLGGVRLISSARIMLAKTGPWTNRKTRLPVVRSSSRTSVPVMSEGIRSGVNWMRLNDRSSTCDERADQQRLGQARHADQQAVAPAEHRDQHLLDDLLLPDDDPRELRRHPLVGGVEGLDGLEVVRLADRGAAGHGPGQGVLHSFLDLHVFGAGGWCAAAEGDPPGRGPRSPRGSIHHTTGRLAKGLGGIVQRQSLAAHLGGRSPRTKPLTAPGLFGTIGST